MREISFANKSWFEATLVWFLAVVHLELALFTQRMILWQSLILSLSKPTALTQLEIFLLLNLTIAGSGITDYLPMRECSFHFSLCVTVTHSLTAMCSHHTLHMKT